MITALELAVTREFDVFDPVVVTTGMVHGGTAHNVISDSAAFETTVRSFSVMAKAKLEEVLPRVLKGVALTHGVEVDVDYVTLFPPTISDTTEATWALDLGRESLGADRVLELPFPLAGSEDFSRVLDRVPGAMLFLGATLDGRDPATAPFNHAPEADFDESVMPTGAQLYATLGRGAVEALALVLRHGPLGQVERLVGALTEQPRVLGELQHRDPDADVNPEGRTHRGQPTPYPLCQVPQLALGGVRRRRSRTRRRRPGRPGRRAGRRS